MSAFSHFIQHLSKEHANFVLSHLKNELNINRTNEYILVISKTMNNNDGTGNDNIKTAAQTKLKRLVTSVESVKLFLTHIPGVRFSDYFISPFTNNSSHHYRYYPLLSLTYFQFE
jgi:hypothetical protein